MLYASLGLVDAAARGKLRALREYAHFVRLERRHAFKAELRDVAATFPRSLPVGSLLRDSHGGRSTCEWIAFEKELRAKAEETGARLGMMRAVQSGVSCEAPTIRGTGGSLDGVPTAVVVLEPPYHLVGAKGYDAGIIGPPLPTVAECAFEDAGAPLRTKAAKPTAALLGNNRFEALPIESIRTSSGSSASGRSSALSLSSVPDLTQRASAGSSAPGRSSGSGLQRHSRALSRRSSTSSNITEPTPQPTKKRVSAPDSATSSTSAWLYQTAGPNQGPSSARPLLTAAQLDSYSIQAALKNQRFIALKPLILEALPTIEAPLEETKAFLEAAAAKVNLTDTATLSLDALLLAVVSSIYGELMQSPPGTPSFATPADAERGLRSALESRSLACTLP